MYYISYSVVVFDVGVVLLFFFFKQKTAYEMRISDWSSDVCSSDLCRGGLIFDADPCARHLPLRPLRLCKRGERDQTALRGCREPMFPKRREQVVILRHGSERLRRSLGSVLARPRSEEHTSELQSLMRISYAVFCLKKTKTNRRRTTQ